MSQLRSTTIQNVDQEGGHLAPSLFDSSESSKLAALKNIQMPLFGGFLRDLNFSSNKLAMLRDDQFAALVDLESLNLPIKCLDNVSVGDFRGLARLRELNLSNNTLSQPDEHVFADLPTLEKLNMRIQHTSSCGYSTTTAFSKAALTPRPSVNWPTWPI